MTCGGGESKRTRSCGNPMPQYGGSACDAQNSFESKACNPCPCPSMCNISTLWFSCKLIQLSIACLFHFLLLSNFWVFALCALLFTVNGGWGHWSDYGRCGSSGKQKRTRCCDNPPAQHGGLACTTYGETATHSRSCNPNECPSMYKVFVAIYIFMGKVKLYECVTIFIIITV